MENTNINQNTSNQNIDNQEINIPVSNIPTDENNTGLDNVIDDYLNNGYPDENTYGTMSAGDNSGAVSCRYNVNCKIDTGIDFTTPPPDETAAPTDKPTDSPIQQEYKDTRFLFYLNGYTLGGTYAIFSSGGQSITPTGLVETGALTPSTPYISPEYANYWIYIYPNGSYMTNFNYIYKLKQDDFISSNGLKYVYLTYNYSSSTVPNTNIYFPHSTKLATGQDLSCKGYRYDISKMSTTTANVIAIGTQTVYFKKIFTYAEINSIPQEKYLSGKTQTYFSNYEYNANYKNLLNTTRNVTAAYTTQYTSNNINSLSNLYTVTFTANQMTDVLTGKSVYYYINGVETDSIYLGNIYVGPEVTQTSKIINTSYTNGTSVPITYLNSGAIATCLRSANESTINYALKLYYEIVKLDNNGNDVYILARNVHTKNWSSAMYNSVGYTRLNLSSNILSPTLFINSSYAPSLNNTKNSTYFINNLENGTYAVRLRFEFSPSAASKPCSSGYKVTINSGLNIGGINIGLSYPLTHKCIKYSSIPRNPQVPIYLTLDHYASTATHINIVTAQVGVKYYGIGSSSVKTADISKVTWVYSNIASSASYTGNLYKQISFKTNKSAAASTVTYTITCSIKAVKNKPLYSQGVMNSSTTTNWYQSGSKIRQITVTPMKYHSTVTHVFANLNDQLAGTNKVTELKVYVRNR